MARKEPGVNKANTSQQEELKAVIVGSSGCGKTSLFKVYASRVFPETWSTEIFDTSDVTTRYEGKELHLYDSTGLDGYDHLLSLWYGGINVVLICYDVMQPSTLHDVLGKWYPQVQHFCKGVPIILVGCKTDLRKGKALKPGQNAVTYIEGEEASKEINAALFLECSAKTRENVDDLFIEATKQALMAKKKQKKGRERRSLCALL